MCLNDTHRHFSYESFQRKKADAASITLESKYVYLDISNFSDEWNNNVYMFVDTWGTLQKGEKISGTDIIRWDKSGWGNIDISLGSVALIIGTILKLKIIEELL